jgi:hypothetical protein
VDGRADGGDSDAVDQEKLRICGLMKMILLEKHYR